MIFKNKFLLITLLLNFNITRPMTALDQKKIGEQIWFNETSKKSKRLIYWNTQEEFPSLGIGHFTWCPQGKKITHTQQFPALCKYFIENNITLPDWLQEALDNDGAPWETRDAFLQDTQHREDLLKLLLSTIEVQASFMVKQLEEQWPLILRSAPKEAKKKIARYFKIMRATSSGTYALVDYLNFKGSGLNPKESIKDTRWGLLQVIAAMPDGLTKEKINKAFAESAEKKLRTRVKLAGPKSNLNQFLDGWLKRIRTYAN